MTHITAYLSNLRRSLAELRVNVPAEVDEEYSNRHRLTAAASRFSAPSGLQIAEAWADATLNDRDPFKDPTLQATLFAKALGEHLEYQVGQVVDQRIIAALKQHADPILNQLKNVCADASAHLHAAHAVIGNVPFTAEATAAAGSYVLASWESATEAIRKIDQVNTAWHYLAQLTRFAIPDTDRPIRLCATLDVGTYDRTRRHYDVWAIIHAGHSLDLATTQAEIQARRDRIAQLRKEADEARTEEARRAVKRSFGI